MTGPVARTGAETGVPVPADTVVQGATNTARGYAGPVSSGNDGSGDLRARNELAMFIAVAAYPDDMWSVPTAGDADRIADVVLAADYRRVVDDDTTVERVATAIDEGVRANWHGNPADFASSPEDWTVAARAAVRALREER